MPCRTVLRRTAPCPVRCLAVVRHTGPFGTGRFHGGGAAQPRPLVGRRAPSPIGVYRSRESSAVCEVRPTRPDPDAAVRAGGTTSTKISFSVGFRCRLMWTYPPPPPPHPPLPSTPTFPPFVAVRCRQCIAASAIVSASESTVLAQMLHADGVRALITLNEPWELLVPPSGACDTA
jgi:hypothetical protein